MPLVACGSQYAAVLVTERLKLGLLAQVSCEQRLVKTFTMPSTAWSLQYAAVGLPSTLKLGCFVQEAFEQRAIVTEYHGREICRADQQMR